MPAVSQLQKRLQRLESIRAQKAKHVVLAFVGTPKADAKAEKLIEQGRAEAERLGKDLQVIRVRWNQ
jgi:MFS superfamily sulfate permease-like transporter